MTNKLSDYDGLGFLLYRSQAAPGLGSPEMRGILATARHRNQHLGLTGCLHHEEGLFFQWLEGPRSALMEVYASICTDPRHHQIELLGEGALAHRLFQNWRMRFSDRDQSSLMEWFARSDSSTVDRGDYAGGITAFLQSVGS